MLHRLPAAVRLPAFAALAIAALAIATLAAVAAQPAAAAPPTAATPAAAPTMSAPPASAPAVAEIVVEGSRAASPESIRSLVAIDPGAKADAATLDRAIKALMATGRFADVTIERQGGRLVVRVVEHPLVAAVVIEGNTAIETKKLAADLQLKAGLPMSNARLQADARRIREAYRRLGRFDTTVEPRTKAREDGRVEVAFAVREAPVAKVSRIDFRGNRAIAASRLKDVVATSESSWLDILKAAAFYDPERIETDRELVRRHYADNGFPDARILDAEAVRGPDGAFVVTFVVEEGQPARFGKVAIDKRLEAGLPAGVEAAIKIPPGKPYSRAAVERAVEAVGEALTKGGLPFARVTPIDRASADGATIDVVLRVEAGPATYAERIEIVGNKRTKDFVIRQTMRLAEGDPVNARILERARARLMATGFFKSVAVRPARGSAPDRAIVTFEVEEQETAEIGFGAGYSSNEGLVGDVSWTERNLFGNGQSLRFKVSGSATRLQADVGFTEPRILGSNVAGGFDLFWKDVDYTKQASYMSWRAGGTVRAGVPIDEQWSVGTSYTYQRSTLYNVGAGASAVIRDAVPGYPAAGSATWDTSSIGSSVTFDTRDNKRRPSSGVYVTLAQDFAGAGGDTRFIRHVGEARGYYTVADGVTVMGRVQGGQITGWGGQDVRLLDLFQKGGETVRGFATGGIGPRDTLSANLDALGGRFFVASTAEAMFEIPGVSKETGLRAGVFADAGSLWGTTQKAAALPGIAGSAPALRASAGIGLAWDSPLGPLRVDYAIPLVKQPYDKTQAFSFGLAPY